MKGRSGARLLAATLGLAGLAAAAGLTGCSEDVRATPQITSTARPGVAPTPPRQGAFFGAWVEPRQLPEATPGPRRSPAVVQVMPPPAESDAGRVAAVAAFEKDLGRRLDIAVTYRTWEQPFPQQADSTLAGARQLLLNWDGADTQKIVSGAYDTLIRQRARSIKALGKPVFLRWQRDMDTRALRPDRIHSAADFIAAWKHLRRIFQAERADNVAWVWSPSLRGMAADAPAAAAFYPGDDQVDWIATDVFPGGAPGAVSGGGYDYLDFSEAAHVFLAWAKKRPKPVMIGEFGVPRSYNGRRAEWLRKAAQYLQDPFVKAVVYFDSDLGGTDVAGRRRFEFSLRGDRSAFSGLREMATIPYFNPRNLPVTPG